MTTNTQLKVIQGWLLSVFLLAFAVQGHAAPLDLSDAPLFLGTNVDPNVFFQVDDSGSMDWEIMTQTHDYYTNYWEDAGVSKVTDGLWLSFFSYGYCAGRRSFPYYFAEDDNLYDPCTYFEAEENPEAEARDWRVRSSDFNLLFYNPEIDYEPWPGKPDADFYAARSNPQPGSAGYDNLRDLSGFTYDVAIDDHGYQGSRPQGPASATDTPNGDVDLFDSRVSYTVQAASIERRELITADASGMAALNNNCDLASALATVPYADCFGTTSSTTTISSGTDDYGRTVAETRQNIANWYQYSRRRSFVAKGAIASVISSSPSFRFALSVINEHASLFVEVPADGVAEYSTHNAALLEELYDYQWGALGTPLRLGLERTGRYFDNELAYADPIISSCQQNFGVLFTDGYWSGAAPSVGIGDADGDGHSHTLADVAKYYYDKDLSPLPNQVPTSLADDNDNQHMVTFTVAFGVQGNLVDTDNDNKPNPTLTESGDWGNPYNSDIEKIDDVWHAAFNSRGVFVAAQTPEDVVDAIRDALGTISDRIGSSASVATNSGTLSAGSHLFQARFDSADWSGQLLAFSFNGDGSLNDTADWNAGHLLNSQHFDTGRTLLTFNPTADVVAGGDPEGQGVAFRWPNNYNSPNSLTDLSTEQIEYLLANSSYAVDTVDSAERIANQNYGRALTDYLRGDDSNEAVGYGFRIRNSVLGDIVNSDPVYVGAPRFRYPDDLESKSYSAFRNAYSGRDPMVYVGANDGMLHGFTEDSGSEELAYIPNAVYRNLADYAEPDYMHRYFADGGPNIVDAFLSNTADPLTGTAGAWRSVLASGLGGGGQAVFALDVTDPSAFTEANAASLVLWEFDDSQDADLGYTYSRPQIAKMADGRWAAVFGNGYNNTEADGNASTTGYAVLYIVDLETGELIRKLSTESGSTVTPNGLATPVLTDTDGDSMVDHIYAGDLRGQLWKFTVDSSNSDQWDVSYSAGSTPKPLFTTSGNQPITTQPQIARHPDARNGFMLYFGTGKYLEIGDNSPTGEPTQSFYGIWDKHENSLTDFDSSDLLLQFIDDQYMKAFDTDGDGNDDTNYELRDVSDNEIDFDTHMGWKIDLLPQAVEGVANASNFGEKQVSNAILRDGRVIFTTVIPSQQPCDFGGSSFVMELDFRTGGKLAYPAFDLNGDDVFDSSDTEAAGRRSDIGIVPTLSILSSTDGDVAFASGSSGDVDEIELNTSTTASGRQSWRELDF